MKLSRRHFLRSSVGAGLLLGLGDIPRIGRDRAHSASQRAGAGNPLRIPPTFSGDVMGASIRRQNVWPDRSTEVWTLGGGYPAPTIRARRGETFSTRLVNDLPEETNIHFHGLIVPPGMDGHPMDVALPGGTFDYSFTVDQPAGTYWYHPHAHMLTGPQIYKGMAGFFIIEDEEELALGLPSGEYDIPLLIQDRRADPSGEFTYHLEDEDHLYGYLGTEILVNGTPDAFLEVAAGLYRFRILNGSNARVLDLAFAGGRRFHLIANDGGLLDKPYELDYIYLAPAERIEILVDFSRFNVGDSVVMKTLPYSGASGDRPQQGTEMQVIRFDIVRPADGPVTIPPKLVEYERLDPASARRTRTFELRINHDTMPETHTINGRVFEMERIDERVPVGEMEIWSFTNISFLQHPIHIHGARFQVLGRSPGALAPRDFGWKDTIYMRPSETVRLLVRFAPWVGTYLAHCHNLEHEDHGMMFNFAVVEGTSGVSDEGSGRGRMELR